ncbi:hypothetical protein GCM10007916_34530 [Psychromonas marina]|uniref:Uncharacterized protein n=1 Tax=Psychromonas marina TaxID=88364 RepID=A0ABQ6E4S0_9GAMM|nr:hypothetical protein [Psychromonas marina]GLS92382.1 hypothetical protein GCM10007916_34530 [Psychromonas marina]
MKTVLLRCKYIKLLIFLSAIFTSNYLSAESLAIFSANDDFKKLSAGKAKMLFKGKVKRLNNQKYSLVDWPAGSDIKIQFYNDLLEQSESQINATRAKLIFSGRGFPPKEMDKNNFESLQKFLLAHPNSIGYAPASLISDEFNLLFILQTESNDEK